MWRSTLTLLEFHLRNKNPPWSNNLGVVSAAQSLRLWNQPQTCALHQQQEDSRGHDPMLTDMLAANEEAETLNMAWVMR